jgi:hypothetical protein
MRQFIIGALAGGLAVWFWGEGVRQFVGSKTNEVRDVAADKLQAVENRATNVLDRTKDQVSSTLQAGQDILRQRAS